MIVQSLEKIGFLSLNTRRLGPCYQCEKTITTYYVPELKRWYCEDCYYSNPQNKEFNYLIGLLSSEDTMATPNLQELMARLDKLEAENTALKAKSTDNVFVGGTDNLTLKHRQVNPRGWAVPTKNQQGQGYLRSGEFPMGFFVSQDGTKIVLHQEIPATPREVQLFKERFLMQQIVVAKRRTDQAGSSTPTTPGATPTSTPTSSTTSASSTPTPATAASGKTFASLSQAEKDALVAEARGLMEAGLFTSLPEALGSVLSSKHISK